MNNGIWYFLDYVEDIAAGRPLRLLQIFDSNLLPLCNLRPPISMSCRYVVDSHIQRIVLATEETTVTQQVSHRPIKCQSRLWSQRGTKVNGSHHGDNPLLRPTGIQIATKSYAALQAMAPTNIKTVIKPPYSISRATSIDSECCRLPTTSVLSKKTEKYAPTSFDQQVQVSQGHTFCTEIRKIEIPRSMVVEALNW